MAPRTRWRRAARHGTVAVVLAASGLFDAAVPQPAAAGPAPDRERLTITGTEQVEQTEAGAVARAARRGRPVEIGAFRSERREVYANPDGTLTAREHVQPVRTIRAGRWVPVDATLVRQADGSYAPRAAVIGLRVSGGGDGPLLEAGRADRRMSLAWPGRLPTPTVDGARATYGEVLPGVDLVVNVTPTGFSHVLVVKTREAARSPRLTAVEFGIGTAGLDLRTAAHGGVEVVDRATNGAVFEGGEPTMWDSGEPASTRASTDSPLRAAPESARVARMGLRLGDGKLTLRPDQAMLADPATRWPVYLDPVWESTANSAWAMVDSGYPNEEYWKFDGKPHERVAMCPPNSTPCNNSKIKRLFYELPTPYWGKEIISAEFRITMVHTYDGVARGVNLYRTGPINAGTNWNNQPGGAGWAGAAWQDWKAPTGKQAACTATNQNVGFNATPGVREAAAGGWASTTFGILPDLEHKYESVKRFCDNAVLSVNYNRAPDRPNPAELTMSPGGACVAGTDRPYVDTRPVLNAVLRDPDHTPGRVESVRAQFRVTWPAGGATEVREYETSPKVSGSTFSYDSSELPIPENVTVSWQVRAGDGHAWGPWSGDNGGCEFVFDKTTPTPPLVVSAEYLRAEPVDCARFADEAWRDGVGRYGTFTFDSAAPDVVEYRYGFNTNPSPSNVLRPATDGGPVSLRWLAEQDGPTFVTVQAVDRARRASAIATCHFRVRAEAPTAEWSLGDAAGATSAADGRGLAPAIAGPGVTFGLPGPGGAADPAVRLTGAPDGYLATERTAIVDTRASFSVSVWVYLTDDTRDAVAVSQSGSAQPGFTVGFGASTKRWRFEVPMADFNSPGTWWVVGPTAVKNTWTHLTAVYDAEQQSISLYVNAGAPAKGARRSRWKAGGAVQIGRQQSQFGDGLNWSGALADVLLFNRVVVPHEVTALAALPPVRAGYWQVNESTGAHSPEYGGGRELTLAGGARVYRFDPATDPAGEPALVGSGHLVLDGVDGHATTGIGAVTDASFTVTARVRLAAPPSGRAMTVLSRAGSVASGFILRCAAAGRWELALPTRDAVGAPEIRAVDDRTLPNADPSGQHLAVVYNAVTNEVKLYVNGELATAAVAVHAEPWRAGGDTQVGRALIDGGWREYFGGAIDDVRVYAGAADAPTVQRLASRTEQPDL